MNIPSNDLGHDLGQFHTTEELVQLVRKNLAAADALPPGRQRDQHLKIVASIRTSFKDQPWLLAAIDSVAHPDNPAAHPDNEA